MKKEAIIQISNITKSYKDVEVLKGIDTPVNVPHQLRGELLESRRQIPGKPFHRRGIRGLHRDGQGSQAGDTILDGAQVSNTGLVHRKQGCPRTIQVEALNKGQRQGEQ